MWFEYTGRTIHLFSKFRNPFCWLVPIRLNRYLGLMYYAHLISIGIYSFSLLANVFNLESMAPCYIMNVILAVWLFPYTSSKYYKYTSIWDMPVKCLSSDLPWKHYFISCCVLTNDQFKCIFSNESREAENIISVRTFQQRRDSIVEFIYVFALL